MEDTVSDGALKPPNKRRRVLDPSSIVPVPVYSSRVNNSLQLRPMTSFSAEPQMTDDGADDFLWSEFSPSLRKLPAVTLSDSEEEEGEHVEEKPETKRVVFSPSPPPPLPAPESPVHKQSRHVRKKISEVEHQLQQALLSPEPQGHRASRRRRRQGNRRGQESWSSASQDGEKSDDDVIIVNSPPQTCTEREIPLKIRCRTEVHKIPVLPSTPLSQVLTRLSSILNVPPSALLLLREELELPQDSSVGELGLGITDILECVVMVTADRTTPEEGVIKFRVQSKDRDASQEFSLHRDAALGSVLTPYLSCFPPCARKKVVFHFDGSKVSLTQTPAELDMEDGDILEVWT